MIKVNNEVITEKEFDLACADSKKRFGLPALKKEHLDIIAWQLVDARLFLVKARDSDIVIDEEEVKTTFDKFKGNFKTPEEFDKVLESNGDSYDTFEAKIKDNMLLDKYLKTNFYAKVEVAVEDAEKYYNQYKEKFVSQDRIAASHILFKEDDLETAKKVKSEIDNGADFAEKALAHSECPSKSNKGSLGLFGKGQMVKEFEEAAFNSAVNEVVGPIKTQFGYHIIKVDHKEEAKNLDFADVKEDLLNQMKQSVVNENIKKLAMSLREENKIEIDEKLLASKEEK